MNMMVNENGYSRDVCSADETGVNWHSLASFGESFTPGYNSLMLE